jgi:hypothetical protein
LRQDILAAKNSAREIATQKIAQLREVSALLNASDIAVIPLKGTSLLTNVYKDRPFRTMHDVDILIAKDHSKKTIELLQKSGFELEDTAFRNRWHKEIYQTLKDDLNDCRIQRASFVLGNTKLDLHWSLIYEAFKGSVNLDVDEFWKTSEQDFSLGKQVYRLNPKHELMLILLHCNDFYSPSLTQLLDLCVLKQRYHGNLEEDLKDLADELTQEALLELKELIRSIPSEENLNVPYEDLSPAHLKIYETFFNQIRRERMTSDRDWPKVAKEKMGFKQKLLFYSGYFFPDPEYYRDVPVTVRYFKHWAALIKKAVRRIVKT